MADCVAEPPDGGCKVRPHCRRRSVVWVFSQAWLVMFCSFLVNGIVFSIINTFGILFVELKKNLEESGTEDAAFKCGEDIKL